MILFISGYFIFVKFIPPPAVTLTKFWIHLCMYVCMYVCMFEYVCMIVRTCVRIYVCMYVRMYVLVRMYGCVRLCLWLRTLELAFPATLTFV